jgi:hypothetical protein
MNGILIGGRFGSFVGVGDVGAAVDDAAGRDDVTGVSLLRAGDAAPATVSDGIGAGVGSLKSNRGRAPPA